LKGKKGDLAVVALTLKSAEREEKGRKQMD